MKNYRTINGLQTDIRKHGTKDYLMFKGIIFTMDDYDSEGKEIRYGNIKNQQCLLVETSNRYGNTKFKDAKVYIEPLMAWRTDINYAE